MDVLELFKMTVGLFVKFFNIQMTIGGYSISVASVFIFVILSGIIITFVRRLAE